MRVVTEVLDSPAARETLGRRAVARARQFSWATVARETIEVYRELLDRTQGPDPMRSSRGRVNDRSDS